MIVKVKVKSKDWQDGDEIEFRGLDAIDQAVIFLAQKYGTMNRTVS